MTEAVVAFALKYHRIGLIVVDRNSNVVVDFDLD